jgi:hypothetical protein|tara:strand:+ start:1797 stop:2669 length:873 start_codon:yes stop_codon:yes gene_type:complete
MENTDNGSVSNCLNDQNGDLHPTIPPNTEPSECLVYEDNIEALNAAFSAFKEAEDYIKKSEISVGELDIPSVNELRYFGYHLVKALSNPELSKTDQLEEIHRAKKHAQRASYDAIELGLISNLEVIADFHTKYGDKSYLTEIHNDYYALMTRVEEIKVTVGQESRHDRAEYYRVCEGYLVELTTIKNKLELSKSSLASREEEILNNANRLERAEERAEKAERRSKYAYWVTVASLVLAVYVAFAKDSSAIKEKATQESGHIEKPKSQMLQPEEEVEKDTSPPSQKVESNN